MPTHHLLIIDPSIKVAEDEGVNELLALWPGTHDLCRPVLEPQTAHMMDSYDADAIVVLGSAASVFDDYDWLRTLHRFLEPVVSGELVRPLLGVCFGHQLIGHIAGAEVGFLREDHSKLAAVQTTHFAGSRLWPDGDKTVVASHREEVKTVPDGYRVVARRGESQRDAFEHDTLPIFTTQFHPEARLSFIARQGIASAATSARSHVQNEVGVDGRGILKGFLDLALCPY